MGKSVAISQSNYIPWKGYFDFMACVDEFILYDDVQYTKRDWRNRNRIKTPHGLKWLSIPVNGSHSMRIEEVEIADPEWNDQHWRTIRHTYSQAQYFDFYESRIRDLYEEATFRRLSAINRHFLSGINTLLGIDTPLSLSTDYNAKGSSSERLLSICKQANADEYVTGPSAKKYLDTSLFEQEGISIRWMNYGGYKPYRQLYGAFKHEVSIIDLLFNTGPDCKYYLKMLESEVIN